MSEAPWIFNAILLTIINTIMTGPLLYTIVEFIKDEGFYPWIREREKCDWSVVVGLTISWSLVLIAIPCLLVGMVVYVGWVSVLSFLPFIGILLFLR